MLRFVWFILFGIAAGWIASRLMGAGRPGVLGLLIVGGVGSIIGPLLFAIIGFKTYGIVAELIASVVGAVICIYALRTWGPRF
ncbi:MAG: GlsB/YeaQ/YmgE family stress response membrane protein [Lacipirellulaceae bacterium]